MGPRVKVVHNGAIVSLDVSLMRGPHGKATLLLCTIDSGTVKRVLVGNDVAACRVYIHAGGHAYMQPCMFAVVYASRMVIIIARSE